MDDVIARPSLPVPAARSVLAEAGALPAAGRLRVTIVEPRGGGGMIHYAYQLGCGLVANGCDVTLLTSNDYELADLEPPFRVEPILRLQARTTSGNGVPVGRAAIALHRAVRLARRAVRAAVYVREWVRIVRYLERQRPDIVQFGSIPFHFEAIFLRRLRRSGLAMVQVCHEYDYDREAGREAGIIRRRLRAPLQRAVLASFDAVFVHSERNRQDLRERFAVPAERLHVIDHGNEELLVRAAVPAAGDAPPLRARLGIGDDLPLVLFFGTLNPSKGVPDLIRAFAQLVRRVPARLIIAGYPSKLMDTGALGALAHELGIAERVHFDLRYIPLEEVGSMFDVAQVVCLPYVNASQSGVLQVAYAFGCPVVATNVGGLPEVVEHERTGLLVPPGSPADLAAALERILGDDGLRGRMAERARELARTRYSWTAVTADMLAAFARAGLTRPEPVD